MGMEKGGKVTKDLLIRGIPQEIASKLKVAASLHRMPMKEYVREILRKHLEGLERKGLSLSLPKGR